MSAAHLVSNLALTVGYAGCSAWLVVAHRDQRGMVLAGAFALVASAFANKLLAAGLAWNHLSASWLVAIQPIAWLPAMSYTFFRDFPATSLFPEPANRRSVPLAALALLGLVLCIADLSTAMGWLAIGAPVSGILASRVPNSAFWPVVLAFPAVDLSRSFWRSRNATAQERNRVRILLGALVLGCAPVLAAVIASELIPGMRRFVLEPGVFGWVEVVVLLPLVSVPFAAAYAIQVHKAIAVRVIIRRAVQYGLARYTLLALTALPLVVFAGVVYQHRRATVDELLTGGPAPWLLLLAGLSGAALRVRQRALTTIDRRFFREDVEAERVMAEVVRGCRRAKTVAQLDHVVSGELDRAFHVSIAALLVRDDEGKHLRALNERVPSLAIDGYLADVLTRGEPIDVAAVSRGTSLGGMTPSEAAWVGDTGASLLIPLLGRESVLLGLLLLGRRLSEQPFRSRERNLLSTIGDSVAGLLEGQLLGIGTPSDPPPTRECPSCGDLGALAATCAVCGTDTRPADVPRRLGGKYRLLKRLGAGGMGVVYLAEDETLGRHVAVKTLPGVADVLGPRLVKEARAMARISDPGVATIYGLERWRGRPMLIVEYLAAGTLADRIAKGPVSCETVLRWGISLATALEHLHEVGILHRDIKPSNIGFAADGRPKLLDLGLAKLTEIIQSTGGSPEASSTSGLVVGTLPYMSPDAAAGGSPVPTFDTWSLSVTLFEAIAGANPFAGAGMKAWLTTLIAGESPDLRQFLPSCPPPVAELFLRLLAEEVRPATAADLTQALQATLERLGADSTRPSPVGEG